MNLPGNGETQAKSRPEERRLGANTDLLLWTVNSCAVAGSKQGQGRLVAEAKPIEGALNDLGKFACFLVSDGGESIG